MEAEPRLLTLNEHKILPQKFSEAMEYVDPFNIDDFKKKFKMVIIRNERNEIEFDLIGIQPGLVNAFRRIMLSEVPTMAIEKVHFLSYNSIMEEEVFAHRLGLVPLAADPRKFEFKSDSSSQGGEDDTLQFEMKLKCSYDKEAKKKGASVAADIYKNDKVYSRHFKWVPIGNQKEKFHETEINPVQPDILLSRLRPGQEIHVKAFAVKGRGKDHAKFSPVATAFYRMLPRIRLLKEVEGAAAHQLQMCFSKGVIDVEKNKNGQDVAVVKNARYDTGSRNVFRYADLSDAVEISRVKDHFIFTIESTGALPAADIFKEAVKTFKEKCTTLLDELRNQCPT